MYIYIVILKEIRILDAGNETYEKIKKNQEEIRIKYTSQTIQWKCR